MFGLINIREKIEKVIEKDIIKDLYGVVQKFYEEIK